MIRASLDALKFFIKEDVEMKRVRKIVSVLIMTLAVVLSLGVTASAHEVTPTVTPVAGGQVSAAIVGELGLPRAAALTSGTGVDEVDTMMDNFMNFIYGIAKAVGVLALVLGIIQIAMSIMYHDPSQRVQGFFALAGGVIIFFVPEILAFIQGG